MDAHASHSEPVVAICVVGWHYPDQFYEQLSKLAGVAIFVVSHRPAADVPPALYRYLPASCFSFEANIGYDWGCYQQFLDRGEWRKFDYIFFIHDDVIIKDSGFVAQCVAMLDQGYSVVGNGRVAPQPTDWPRLYPAAYAIAEHKPKRDFKHDGVRGSFFATTRAALEELGTFDVFWDPLRLTSGFGNWSARVSCAKFQAVCGEKCYAFLSETYCVSDYLYEFVRGGDEEGTSGPQSKFKRFAMVSITKIFTAYMKIYWQQGAFWQPLALVLLSPLIYWLSGQWLHPSAKRVLQR
jgi:hypothetical protein